MDADDYARLDAYARSQNYFQGLGTDIVTAMLEAFIRRALPWLGAQIRDAASAAWDWIKSRIGW
jgi:hypothetical protein